MTGMTTELGDKLASCSIVIDFNGKAAYPQNEPSCSVDSKPDPCLGLDDLKI